MHSQLLYLALLIFGLRWQKHTVNFSKHSPPQVMGYQRKLTGSKVTEDVDIERRRQLTDSEVTMDVHIVNPENSEFDDLFETMCAGFFSSEIQGRFKDRSRAYEPSSQQDPTPSPKNESTFKRCCQWLNQACGKILGGLAGTLGRHSRLGTMVRCAINGLRDLAFKGYGFFIFVFMVFWTVYRCAKDQSSSSA